MRCNIGRWMLAAVLTILLMVGGAGALEPATGDLNGDGTDSYGTFDPSTAGFTFNGKTVHFGTSTDLPVMGDWDHDGKDEIGVFRPDEGGQSKFYLITRDWATFSDGANAGAADKTIPFGYYPNNIPIAGDWDGDGDDDIGGFNPDNNNFYLYLLNLPSSSATPYAPHPSVSFGTAGDTPIIGDWDGDGDDDVGIFRSLDPNPSTNSFYLDLSLTGGQHELGPYIYGNVGDKPIAGDWDGDGDDNIGVYRPSTEQFYTDSNIPPYPMSLYVTVSESPDPVTSGGTSQVTIRVTTTGGTPVSGASVSVSATGGSLIPTSGTTDANGDFKPTYTAPTVTTPQTYTISATTSKTGYTSGSASDTITVYQSSTTLTPITGDLNGDGTDSYGTFDPSTAGFTFNGKTIHFGTSTDLPIMGDWDHDGKDEIGVFRPDEGGQSKFYLITRDWATFSDGANAGAADKTIPFGYYPNNIPIAGDWDGDGDNDIGGFNPDNNNFYLYILNLPSSSATPYAPHPSVSFGTAGDTPIIGDWDGDGDDDVGVCREYDPDYSSNLVFYFDLDLGGNQADLSPAPIGNNGDVAVIGDWDRDGDDDVGLYRAGAFIIDPDLNIPHDLVYLDNGIVKVGVDLEWGGAISVIMHQGMNLIDNRDTGRLAQVAFYNDDSGTWDPVQGGDVFNQGSPVLDYNKGAKLIYTKTHPRDWKTGVLTDTYIEQWVSLEGQSVKVQYKFTHFGTNTYTFHDQEFPCAYINSQLYRLITYTNSNPWADGGVNEFSIPQTDPGTPNTEFYPTEYWASFVNDLNFGLTLYSPDHTSKWAAHRFTVDTQPSYLVTIDQFVIEPGTVEEATEYFIVGNYPDTRNIVYSLESGQSIITVDDDGPADYNSIRAAVDAASDGDTIEVRSGTYYENVDVNKQLTLRGIDAGEGMPVVYGYCDGWGDGGVITVRANGCVLNGFVVMGWSDWWDECAGIVVLSDDNTLIDNNVSNHYGGYGIHLEYSNNNTLTSNTANSNNDCGIYLYHSSNNTLTDNNASNNYWRGYGIYLEYSSDNTLRGNVMSGNTYNFGVRGDNLSEYVQNIDTSNKVDGKPIYYWVDQQDQQIPGDAGYVGIVDCTNIVVRDLTLTNNYHGVLFAYTVNSRIENVATLSNGDGIYLYSSSGNTLQINIANSNNNGIYLESSSGNTLSDNTASDNRDGIRLSHSSDNVLQNNIVKSNDWWYGIYLEYSNNNVLTDNNASNNGCGIYLESSNDNTLSDNMMSENGNNFGVGGDSLPHYIQNIDTSNKVDEKPIYYWVGQHDQQIPDDAGYVGGSWTART